MIAKTKAGIALLRLALKEPGLARAAARQRGLMYVAATFFLSKAERMAKIASDERGRNARLAFTIDADDGEVTV